MLLADEPTGNLDEHTRDEIFGLLEGLWKNRRLTMVVVTHDGAIARRAQRIATIKAGRVGTGHDDPADRLDNGSAAQAPSQESRSPVQAASPIHSATLHRGRGPEGGANAPKRHLSFVDWSANRAARAVPTREPARSSARMGSRPPTSWA